MATMATMAHDHGYHGYLLTYYSQQLAIYLLQSAASLL